MKKLSLLILIAATLFSCKKELNENTTKVQKIRVIKNNQAITQFENVR